MWPVVTALTARLGVSPLKRTLYRKYCADSKASYKKLNIAAGFGLEKRKDVETRCFF